MTPPDGTWTWYTMSKYPAQCGYCGIDIPMFRGRWTLKAADGKRWNACSDCLKPPAAPPERNDPPPLPQATMKPFEDRETVIAKARAENLEASKQMRNAIALLIVAIDRQTAVLERRNEMFKDVKE